MRPFLLKRLEASVSVQRKQHVALVRWVRMALNALFYNGRSRRHSCLLKDSYRCCVRALLAKERRLSSTKRVLLCPCAFMSISGGLLRGTKDVLSLVAHFSS